MKLALSSNTTASNYALKYDEIALSSSPMTKLEHVSLSKLEAMRVQTEPLTASKLGLEVICGASCEISAW